MCKKSVPDEMGSRTGALTMASHPVGMRSESLNPGVASRNPKKAVLALGRTPSRSPGMFWEPSRSPAPFAFRSRKPGAQPGNEDRSGPDGRPAPIPHCSQGISAAAKSFQS